MPGNYCHGAEEGGGGGIVYHDPHPPFIEFLSQLFAMGAEEEREIRHRPENSESGNTQYSNGFSKKKGSLQLGRKIFESDELLPHQNAKAEMHL